MKRKNIQFLRFIAITAVLIFFIWPEILPNAHLGGSLFFVISGYLLATNFEEKTKLTLEDVKEYYFRRYRRSGPTYLVILIILMFLLYGAIWREDIGALIEVLHAGIFYFFHSDEYDAEKSADFFQHCWAMKVHLIFSFIYPIFMYFVLHFSWILKNKTNILLIGISLNLTFIPFINVNSFFGRFWQFCLGILAFDNPLPKNYLNLYIFIPTMLVIGGLPLVPKYSLPPSMDIFEVFGCTLFLAFNNAYMDSDNPHIFFRALCHIGDISFVIYLISWPIITYCRYIFGLHHLNFLIGSSIFILCGSLALFVHHFIERPLRRICESKINLICITIGLYIILVISLIYLTSPFFVALKW